MKAALLAIVASATVVVGCGLGLDYTPDIGALQAADAPAATPPLDDAGMLPETISRCTDSNPFTSVMFARDIRPITQKSPGGCSCHSTNTTSGFNLGTYDGLRRGGTNSGTRIIVPGKPCESILVQKLGLAPPYGARMPYNGPPYLSAAELTLISDWIAEGALDN